MKKILISFVGINDAGKLLGESDGAILTALQNENFDELILLWNEDEIHGAGLKFSDVVRYIRREAKKRGLVKASRDEEFEFNDVTDHNEIYAKLKEFTDTLEKNGGTVYVASISSGTPAMSACWILLAESGDFSEEFPLRLIKVKDPKYGKSENVEVKLSTSLPKIIRMKKELKKFKNALPEAKINVKKGTIEIDGKKIDVAPIEFCYYRYFAELKLNGEEKEKFSGNEVPERFHKKIIDFHSETFPYYDAARQQLEKMLNSKPKLLLSTSTFRGNITKLNKKIKRALGEDLLYEQFKISSEGKRGAKFYGINAPKEKLKIV